MESEGLFRCPVCRQGTVVRTEEDRKSLFGLKKATRIACGQCGAAFSGSAEGLRLDKKPTDKGVLRQYADLARRYGAVALKAGEWTRIAEGGVSDREQEELDQKAREEKVFEKLANGDLSSVPMQTDVPIALKKDEGAYVDLNGVRYVEERTRTTYAGGSRGVSIRVMKGVSFRTGGFKGERVPVSEKVELDQGRLIITNRRVVFSGPRKNVSFPLAKIIEVHEYKDGISISREGKQKTEYYLGQFEIPNLKYHSVWELVKAVIYAACRAS